jgi:hypothetical protein
MVQPFFLRGRVEQNFSDGDFCSFWVQLIQAWWSGCFAGVFEDFVVQRGGKSW